jgi:hypothetical protein
MRGLLLIVSVVFAVGACDRPLNLEACANHSNPDQWCRDMGTGQYCELSPSHSGSRCSSYDGSSGLDAAGAGGGGAGGSHGGTAGIAALDANSPPPDANSLSPDLRPSDGVPQADVRPTPDAPGDGPSTCPTSCTLGAWRCGSSGGTQECVASGGCPAWASEVPCLGAKSCSGGVCTCPLICIEGAQRCGAGGGVQVCDVQNGCLAWSTESPCQSPTTCHQNGSAAGCACAGSGCLLNTQQCGPGGGVQTCTMSGSCTAWSPETPCQGPASCHQTGGVASCCANACTLGAQQCGQGGGRQTCVMNGMCTAWGTETPCQGSATCHETGGGPPSCCADTCTLGAAKCGPAGDPETCVMSGACSAWESSSSCPAPQVCPVGGTRCQCPKDNSCTLGAQQCGPGGGIQTCVSMGSCTTWGPEALCPGGFCDVTSGRCASPKGFGGSCATADQCASGFCAPNHQCCAATETNNDNCFTSGTICQKSTGACGFSDGSTCTMSSQCASRNCKYRGFCTGKVGGTVECTNDDGVCVDPTGCKFSSKCEP